jgi:hypothetical protein
MTKGTEKPLIDESVYHRLAMILDSEIRLNGSVETPRREATGNPNGDCLIIRAGNLIKRTGLIYHGK